MPSVRLRVAAVAAVACTTPTLFCLGASDAAAAASGRQTPAGPDSPATSAHYVERAIKLPGYYDEWEQIGPNFIVFSSAAKTAKTDSYYEVDLVTGRRVQLMPPNGTGGKNSELLGLDAGKPFGQTYDPKTDSTSMTWRETASGLLTVKDANIDGSDGAGDLSLIVNKSTRELWAATAKKPKPLKGFSGNTSAPPVSGTQAATSINDSNSVGRPALVSTMAQPKIFLPYTGTGLDCTGEAYDADSQYVVGFQVSNNGSICEEDVPFVLNRTTNQVDYLTSETDGAMEQIEGRTVAGFNYNSGSFLWTAATGVVIPQFSGSAGQPSGFDLLPDGALLSNRKLAPGVYRYFIAAPPAQLTVKRHGKRLVGTLTADGAVGPVPISHLPVELQERPAGHAGFFKAATGLTSSKGQVSFATKPAGKTAYRLVFAGTQSGLARSTRSSIITIG